MSLQDRRKILLTCPYGDQLVCKKDRMSGNTRGGDPKLTAQIYTELNVEDPRSAVEAAPPMNTLRKKDAKEA